MAEVTPSTPVATDAQLDAAFNTLIGRARGDMEPGRDVVEAATKPVEEVAEPKAAVQSPQTSESESEPAVEAVESEDVAALRAQLETARAERDGFADKAEKSLAWSRSGYLKKASEADRAKQYLKAIAEGKEIDRAEVERFLAGTPAQQDQPSPVPALFPSAQPVVDDATLMDINRFTFKNRLGDEAAQKFIEWTSDPKSGLTQDDVVPNDTFHTLELMYGKYLRAAGAEPSQPSAATVRAAKTIQAVQKQAARAAGAITTRAKPAPEPEEKQDLLKLAATDVEGFRKRVNISDLIAQVMGQR